MTILNTWFWLGLIFGPSFAILVIHFIASVALGPLEANYRANRISKIWLVPLFVSAFGCMPVFFATFQLEAVDEYALTKPVMIQKNAVYHKFPLKNERS